MNLRKKLDKLMDIYYELKEEIRRRDKHIYERWKAGGYLIDPDILSMYESISEVIDKLED